MYIAKFIEQQAKQSSPQKAWWQKESRWCLGIVMLAAAVTGLIVALHLSIGYLAAPSDIKAQAGAPGLIFIALLTCFLMGMAALGVWGLISVIRDRNGISVWEFLVYLVLACTIALPLWWMYQQETSIGRHLITEAG